MRPHNIGDVLNKLKGVKRISDKHWTATCPCTGHTHPQGHLSIEDGSDKALITCHERHSYDEIISSLGYESLTYPTNGHREIEAIYQYIDANGKPFEVVRTKPKGFYQRQPDSNGGYINNLEGIEPTLYHNDRLPEAIKNDLTIFIPEGEKDVDRLWTSGKVATCNPMGAGKWRDNYSEALKGADCLIIPDNDEPGQKHALEVSNSLYGKAARIRIVELEEAKDISDWLDRGHDFEELEELIKNVTAFIPPIPPKDSHAYIRENEHADTEHYRNVTKNITDKVLEKENVTGRIKDWINDTSGWFDLAELDKEAEIKTPEDRNIRRKTISVLKSEGIIEKHPSQNKVFRRVDTNIRLIDFRVAGKRTPLSIKYPFGIEKYFNTYPGNLIVIAGAQDAGKTAFLINFVKLNMYDFTIYYQSSEMGETEFANRLQNFDDIKLEDWNFIAEERCSNFVDIIRPDCVNVIDYYEISGAFYEIAEHFRRIYEKLNSGIAVIALQKDHKVDLGRGGSFSLEKPRLYLTMDANRLKIRKCKNWVNPEYNPNGLIADFKLIAGCKFIITKDWYKDERN